MSSDKPEGWQQPTGFPILVEEEVQPLLDLQRKSDAESAILRQLNTQQEALNEQIQEHRDLFMNAQTGLRIAGRELIRTYDLPKGVDFKIDAEAGTVEIVTNVPRNPQRR